MHGHVNVIFAMHGHVNVIFAMHGHMNVIFAMHGHVNVKSNIIFSVQLFRSGYSCSDNYDNCNLVFAVLTKCPYLSHAQW